MGTSFTIRALIFLVPDFCSIDMETNVAIPWCTQLKCKLHAWILIQSVLNSTHPFAHLVVLSFKIIVFDWKLQCITNKATETNFDCPPDHQTSIFTCPKAKFACIYAPGNWTWAISFPALY